MMMVLKPRKIRGTGYKRHGNTEFWWGNLEEGKHFWGDNIKLDVKKIR
jgi:hypothetical protein